MDMKIVQAGLTAVMRELDLELLLVLGHGQIAHRAQRADSRTTPSAVRGTVGELATAHGGTSLLTDRFLVRHRMTFDALVPRVLETG
jgi:hypothetical protein